MLILPMPFDVFVGVLKKTSQNKLALMGLRPFQRFAMWTERLRPRTKVFDRRVKAFEESVFGPCTLARTWGTRPDPQTVIEWLDLASLSLARSAPKGTSTLLQHAGFFRRAQADQAIDGVGGTVR